MSLNVALQMDNVQSINIKSDTTFVIGLEALKRGYNLFYYNPDSLYLEDGEVFCFACQLNFYQNSNKHYDLGVKKKINMREMDVVLMRQDPPFNMDYLSYTYFLDKIKNETLVINDPSEVRNCPEKLFVTDFKEFTPKTLISKNIEAVKQFKAKYKDIIIKPLYAHGGADVYKVNDDLTEIFNKLVKKYNTPIIAQEFIKNVDKGDKRIILIDGEYVGAVNRLPAKGSIISNFVQGGVGEQTSLTEKEQQICNALKKPLQQRNLFLAGIDVIDGFLTEINVTSPTGFQAINHLNNVKLEEIFWDKLEKKLS